MHRGLLLAIACILLAGINLTVPVKANAESVIDRYFSGSHLRVDLLTDQITGVKKFTTELNLRYRQNNFSGFVRGSNYRPYAFQEDGFVVQKWGFNYDLNDWDISIGDFSVVFARGAALSATEERETDRDAQLEGIKVKGNMDWADVTMFWGRHKSDGLGYYISGNNTSNRTGSDDLFGFRFEFDFDPVEIGASYIEADVADFFEQEEVLVTEADVGWEIGNVDFYYETVFYNRVQEAGMASKSDGRAQLAEILYSEPGVSLTGSWVHYDDAHFSYGTAPTLRRHDIDDSEAKADDETGYRLDFRLSPDHWSGHSLRILYADLQGIENKDMDFQNIFIEWTSPTRNDWSATLSYDNIQGFQQYYGALDGTEEAYRATIDGPFFLGGSFHVYSRYRTLSNDFGDDEELEIGFDWHVNPVITVGLFRETSTRPDEPPPPGLFGIPTESPGQWNSAFVTYTPDPRNQFELRIGSQRGGFQCSGGVCAQYPPFKGWHFTYFRYF